MLEGVANQDDILSIRLQGWLVVILVGESAVLLTDAESRDSHQEARLILIRMWLGPLAWLRKEYADCYAAAREERAVRREALNHAASLACEHLLGISSPHCPQWLKLRAGIGSEADSLGTSKETKVLAMLQDPFILTSPKHIDKLLGLLSHSL